MFAEMLTKLRLAVLFAACVLCGACHMEQSNARELPFIDSEFLADVGDPQVKAAIDLIRKDPESCDGYVSLASRYISLARESGDFSLNLKAEKAVEKALSITPDDVNARKLRASLLATFHRFDEARELANELREEFPSDPFVYGVLTDANVELGNYEEAIAAAQKMVDLKPNSSSYARAAHLRSLHGDHKGALDLYTLAARTADPRDKEAQSWCLVSLAKEHLKYGEIDRAEKVLDESLGISPGYQLAMIELARIYAAKGKYLEAKASLSEVIGRSPNQAAQILMGDIEKTQENLKEAQENYAKAEEIGRGAAGDMHRIALLWADRDVRLDEALLIAQKDYETNKDIYAADILAWCLYKNGRYEEARQVIGEAMRLDTKDARIIYHAGMIKKALGQTEAAKRSLALALKLDPDFDLLQARVARQTLNKLN